MRKHFIIILTIISVLVIGIVFNNISIAGGTGCSLQLISSSSSLNPGDEFTLTLKLKDVTVTKGIQGGGGIFKYDNKVFEIVGEPTVSSKWKLNETGREDGYVSVSTVSGAGETADQDIVSIKLKVKSTATAGNYTLQFTNVVSKPVEAQVEQEFASPITTTVTVKSKDNPSNNEIGGGTTNNNTANNNTTNNNTTNNNTAKNNTANNNTANNNTTNNNTANNNTSNKQNQNANANKSEENTPFTGVKRGLGVAIAIALIAAIGAGYRYKKYNSIK